MTWWKDVFARIAMRFSDFFSLIKIQKSLEKEIEKTRTESQDRAFLATKQGRLNEPPYASLRQ